MSEKRSQSSVKLLHFPLSQGKGQQSLQPLLPSSSWLKEGTKVVSQSLLVSFSQSCDRRCTALNPEDTDHLMFTSKNDPGLTLKRVTEFSHISLKKKKHPASSSSVDRERVTLLMREGRGEQTEQLELTDQSHSEMHNNSLNELEQQHQPVYCC